MSRVRHIAIACVLLAPLLTMFGPQAGASAPCQGSGNLSGGDGKYRYPFSGETYLHAVRADIEKTADPALCSSYPAFRSDNWVMLAGPNANQYVQIGYEYSNYAGPLHYYFTEWNNGGSPTTHFWGTPVTGSIHTFSVNRISTGYYHLNLDGVTQYTTPFNPQQYWSTNTAQWSAETNDPGSDIFGTPTNHTDFNHTDVQNQADQWKNPDYSGTSLHPCYYNTNVNTAGVEFHAWTEPLAHNC